MYTTTTLRIPTILYDKICRIATKENRSINSQIVNILNEYTEFYKYKK